MHGQKKKAKKPKEGSLAHRVQLLTTKRREEAKRILKYGQGLRAPPIVFDFTGCPLYEDVLKLRLRKRQMTPQELQRRSAAKRAAKVRVAPAAVALPRSLDPSSSYHHLGGAGRGAAGAAGGSGSESDADANSDDDDDHHTSGSSAAGFCGPDGVLLPCPGETSCFGDSDALRKVCAFRQQEM